jgi:hypothetical protein
MEARIARVALIGAAVVSFCAGPISAASYRTTNFIVQARSPQFAKQVGDLAEHYRRNLAIEWLGQELPRWGDPCPITVEAAPNLGAGGATSFMFDRHHPFGWTMSIQGSEERILDSVLPHEVTHTIFATHFGAPLPRWADEGACTTVEHVSERAKQQRLLLEFLQTNRGIPFNRMFAMTEYPHDILPLYSQGHSLAQYLIAQGGKRKFIDFVGRGMQNSRWDDAVMEFYGFRDLSDLQVTWVDWVGSGSPANVGGRQQLAAGEPRVNPQAMRATDPTGGFELKPLDRSAATSIASSDRSDRSPQRSARPLVDVPPRGASKATRPAMALAENRSSSRGSWYARRGQAVESVSESRQPQVTSRPQQVQQVQERVLEWNSSARIPARDQQAQPRQPILFDAPPSGVPTAWR